jgi:hypothetical protein
MATSLSTRKAIAFFRKHATHNDKDARQLARAEREGKAAGLVFHWVPDTDMTSLDFAPDEPERQLWGCVCERPNEIGENLRHVSSLWGIDLANGHPYPYGATAMGAPMEIGGRDPYCRVVEAELAMEALS